MKEDLVNKMTAMLNSLNVFKKKVTANIDEITAQRIVDDLTAPMYESLGIFNTLIEVGSKRNANDELSVKFTGFDEDSIKEKQNVFRHQIKILLKSRNMIFEKKIDTDKDTMPQSLIQNLIKKCTKYDDECKCSKVRNSYLLVDRY